MPSKISYEAKAYVIDEETGCVLGFKNPDSSEVYFAYTNKTGGELFTGDSLTVKTPVATFERSYDGQASFRPWNLLLINRGELDPDPNDYQNEVHFMMKAGTSSDHRRYINWVGYNDETHFVLGVNGANNFILHDHQSGQHRITFLPATAGGHSYFNASGESGQIRFGFHGQDTPPPLNLRMYAGGAPDSVEVYRFTAEQFIMETATTGPSPQFNLIDADNSDTRPVFRCQGDGGNVDSFIVMSSGRTGVKTATPGYDLDVNGVANAATEFRVAGTKVVGARVVDAALAAVPTAGSATAAANATAINAILALLVAHGLGATS